MDILAQIGGEAGRVRRNLSPAALVEESLRRGEAVLTDTGALRATTGKYTGRSPQDKFLVDDAQTHGRVAWGKVNQPMPPDVFDALLSRVAASLRAEELFVFDGFAGADLAHRLPLRVITQFAWHSLFARQLFVRATPEERAAHPPRLTLLDAATFQADPARDGTRSETVIGLDLTRGVGLIAGTEYAGEIKKSVFTALNFLLPQQGVFPMHCAANIGAEGDVALFFGLSGTGKTTLSADGMRQLIGDDEHGWSERGVFNFEGGCYAKCIGLSAAREPQIWNAIRFGTVLENVVVNEETRRADYDDNALTENTRAAYPLDFILNVMQPSVGGHPKTVLFLTADASGVLPPISKLTRAQALYHFLSGYTSKLAGTERGVTSPEPNFSACFGAPFLPLPPTEYARMLGEKLNRHGSDCFLINTGWSGGPYGVGHRMDLGQTRAMVAAALSGALAAVPTDVDPIFRLHIPRAVPGVPADVLSPRRTWPHSADYDAAARALAARFAENFQKFTDVAEDVKAAGPQG